MHLSGGFSFQIRAGGGGGHPDPEIRGGLKKNFFWPFGSQFCRKIRGGLKKNFFWPFGSQFGLKIRGGPGPSPGSHTAPYVKRISTLKWVDSLPAILP